MLSSCIYIKNKNTLTLCIIDFEYKTKIKCCVLYKPYVLVEGKNKCVKNSKQKIREMHMEKKQSNFGFG